MVDHPVFFRPAEERARVTTLLLWASVVSSGLLTAVAVWDFYLWGNVGIGVDADESRTHVVRALHVCRLARMVPGEPPEAVLPEYLRTPDAKTP